ncbi:MAG: hypothetical protein HWE12_03645 [Oceanospirillaceae bacterium]|nr:hypothetical protein [Oceanospirillaceae bacterium]
MNNQQIAKGYRLSYRYPSTKHTTSYAEIKAKLQTPWISPSKEESNWFVPSTYTGEGFLSAKTQYEQGTFPLIALDIDTGNYSAEELSANIRNVTGNSEFTIYTTASATEQNHKWRVLIPLTVNINAEQYKAHQKRLNSLLGGITDLALANPAQKVILPTIRTPQSFYKAFINHGETFTADYIPPEPEQQKKDLPPMGQMLKQLYGKTPAQRFNEQHTVQEIADRYPNIKPKLRLYENNTRIAYTFKDWIIEAIGKPELTPFDIYRLGEFNGDWQKAINSLR